MLTAAAAPKRHLEATSAATPGTCSSSQTFFTDNLNKSLPRKVASFGLHPKGHPLRSREAERGELALERPEFSTRPEFQHTAETNHVDHDVLPRRLTTQYTSWTRAHHVFTPRAQSVLVGVPLYRGGSSPHARSGGRWPLGTVHGLGAGPGAGAGAGAGQE